MRSVRGFGSKLVPVVAVAAALSGCDGPAPASVAEVAPRNVLLITVDTLRADAIGAYGNRRAATPWIDRLAAGGVRFDRAHAHNVVTLPSHANILSGLYPLDHGVRDNAGFRFPASIPTLATVLKARGYATAAFVSAFPLASRFGLARGFDVYEDSFVDAAPPTPLLEQERRGTATVALARQWLDAHRAEPTFVWVHLFEPHAPYAPPEPLASQFSGDPYAGDVAAADAALEPLLRPILDQGARAETLVVLTADHGESLGEHGEATHGVFAYESTLRVPLIVYAPARLAPRVIGTPVRHVDVAPTILDAVGAPPIDKARGRSLMGIATGEAEAPPPPTYFESMSPALNRGWAPLRGVTNGTLKYIDLPLPELYDTSTDAGETRNLTASRAAEAREMQQRLAEFADATGGAARIDESADTRARLRSLGYTSGAATPPRKYTERDDPKRLVALDARLQDAVRLHSSGDRAGALTVARGLVRERPDMRVAWMTLAQIERDERNLDAAIAAMRRAHALAPEDSQTSALLGAYLTERGRAAEAVALLTPAAASAQPDLQVLEALGLAQAQAGMGADAVATFERARAAYPSGARVLVELGTVQLIAGRRDAARQSFALAVSANPTLARAHSSLAAMDVEEGRTVEAIAGWDQATRLDAGEYGRIFLLGLSLARAQKAGPARTCLAYFADHAPAARYAREIAAARAWLGGR